SRPALLERGIPLSIADHLLIAHLPNCQGVSIVGTSSERTRELRRRRQRTKKYKQLAAKAVKATISEKAHIAAKIRKMSTGGHLVVERLGLEQAR
ncbi:MAG TPA: DUF6800 family protein, partial [Pirellulaceae bacterium]|nr:DUF6800 family protein [Pirellulaceae bacterium]